jgi:alkyl hydroperoxide reductase subunit F
MYELLIIGGGPAAAAAAVYAGRKQINAALVTESFGGQSIVSNEIYNWVGTKAISGVKLAMDLEEHAREHIKEIIEGERVVLVEKIDGGPPNGHFLVTTSGGKKIETKTILAASGSRRRRLGVPGEDKFDGKGVVFCSTCDAPLFKNKRVVIVGAGNAGLEAAVDSIPYASEITLLVRGTEMKGDAITQAKVTSHPKIKIRYNTVIEEIVGDKMVSSVKILEKTTGAKEELPVEGVFVEVGALPNSDFVKALVELDPRNEIIVDPKTQVSSCEGIWAAGDVSNVLYKQNNISSGDAVKALLNIYEYLHHNHLTGAHK